MKKTFTILIAALATIMLITQPTNAVGQTTLTTGDLDFGTPSLSENFNELDEITSTGPTGSSGTTISNLTAYGIFNQIYAGKQAGHNYSIVNDNDFGSNVYILSSKGTSYLIASVTGQSSKFGDKGAFSVKIDKDNNGCFGLYGTNDNNLSSQYNNSVYFKYDGGTLSIFNGKTLQEIGSGYTDNIEVCVVYNNTTTADTYGESISLPGKTAHVYIDGECVMDENLPKAYTIIGGSLTVFRFCPTNANGKTMTLDDVNIYKTLPTAASSDPTINVSPTSLNGFTYSHGNGPSAAQSFTVSGTNLTANISITAPTDYELRQGTTGDFGNSISLTPSNGTVSSTTIYARLKSELAIGNYNSENVSLTSTDATTRTVALSGNVTGYTVTYDGNGKTSGEVPTDGTSYTYNATVTVKSNSGNLAKDHYNFSGWNTQPDGNGTDYTAGTGTFNITANTTLYAKWTPITHTFSTAVTPNNSGTVVAKDGGNNTIASGSSVAETAQLTLTASPAEGYNFTSWSDGDNNSTLSSTTTNPTTFTMGTANVTITATFTARTPATVTLHDGLNGATPTVVNTYTDATLADVIKGHDIASVNGWTALGWVESYTSGTPTLITTSEEVGSTTDLYAVYSNGSNIFTLINDVDDIALNGNYMIGYGSKIMKNVKSTYYMGYTTSNEISDGSFEYVDGRVFILGGTSGAYTFYDGSKYLSATGGSSYVNNLGLSESATTNYEKWSIGFSNNTAQITNNGNTSYMVAFRTGNSYDYFNCHTSTSVNLYKQTSSVNYSITPSAEKCHVTYNANGATSGDVPTDNSEYNPNANVTVLGNTGSLVKTGHTWSGWCLNEEGTGTVYGPAYTKTYAITANTTFYAKWAVNSYSYTLTDDDYTAAELKVGGSTYSEETIPYDTEVEVYVEVEDGYGYTISVKDSGDNDVTLTNNKFRMPASTVTITVTSRLFMKYVLVTSDNQLVAGKHYVIASGISGNNVEGIGYQKSNNRDAVDVKFDDGKLVENDQLWDFVLGGDATNGWTFYDKYTDGEGFLRAPTSNNNYLTLNATTASYTRWSISIASSTDNYKASVVAKGGNRKNMRYNSSSSLFACYANSTDQSDIYLFVKDNDTDYEIYSASPIAGTHSLTTLFVKGKLTINNNAVITVSGEVTNSTAKADSLIIEDGGQLITTSENVKATFKKNIEAATVGYDNYWYLISSPIGTVTTASVTNLLGDGDHKYNLYKFNETSGAWNGNGSETNHFESLTRGNGYLYRNNDGADLTFAGTIVTGTPSVALTRSETNLPGFNLLGNPYSHNITSNYLSFSNDATFTGCYTLKTDGTWTSGLTTSIKPCEGFFVQVSKATTVTFNQTAQRDSRYNQDYIQFSIADGQYEDVTFALFDKGIGLDKINHRNSEVPMIYINQYGQDYAIATMSDDTKSFNLNFKAMKMGQYTLSYKAKGEYNYLHVIDRLTGADVDMLLDGEYSFIASPTDSDNRFIVRLAYLPDYGEGNDAIFAFQSGSDIYVSGEGELQVFDVLGRFVMSERINGATSISADALSKGVYVLRIVGPEIKTQKIVVR